MNGVFFASGAYNRLYGYAGILRAAGRPRIRRVMRENDFISRAVSRNRGLSEDAAFQAMCAERHQGRILGVIQCLLAWAGCILAALSGFGVTALVLAVWPATSLVAAHLLAPAPTPEDMRNAPVSS